MDFFNEFNEKAMAARITPERIEHRDLSNRLPGIVQVFGHTLMDAPVCIGDGASFCLDCRRAFVLDPADGRIRDLVTGDIVG